MARLFFAVGVSVEVSSALGALGAKLRDAEWLRLVQVDQAHYTLRFLGEQPPDRQAAAVRAGRAAANGAEAFELALDALGVFPDERRPHTLWVGAGRGASELVGLAGRLESRLLDEGFSRESRPFVPHLTVARVKRRPPDGWVRALLAAPSEMLGLLQVESFALMESKPAAGTVRYIALETFPLEVPCTPSRSPSPVDPKS